MSHETTPAKIDQEAAAIRRTVFIRAARDSVWNALTVPELMSEWLADSVGVQGMRPGSAAVLSTADDGAVAVRISEVDEPASFAFRWDGTAEPTDAAEAAVTRFTLAEETGGTVLRLEESGLDVVYAEQERADALDARRASWERRLDELAAILEKQDSQ